MEFEDQHREAIAKTVRVTHRVEASVFDDKVKSMGSVQVARGVITVKLDYVPGMVTNEASRDFVLDAIRLALAACWEADREAFDPHALP